MLRERRRAGLVEDDRPAASLAVGEIIKRLLHPPLPLLGVSIGRRTGGHQNDSLADGYTGRS